MNDIGGLLGLLFITGVVSLVALLIWIGISKISKDKKKRTKELKEFALRSGFSYSENADINLCDFDIFGQTVNVFNMLTKTESGVLWRIFDYTAGSGKCARQYAVFMVEQTKSLPAFILRKRAFFNNLFGLKAIVFDNFKRFSDEYYLEGNDKCGIRNVFNENVVRHFENHKLDGPGATIVANMNKIIYYQKVNYPEAWPKPEDLRAKLEEVNELLSVFIK
ncbi:MAG TPA: hypothetical protein VJZ49_14080 [Syntrophales bacterium]|nr:hypothetical protein [Syntrophales bacterium]